MFQNWINKKNLELVEVLRKDIFRGFSIAQLEKKMNLSHHPAYRRIKQIEDENIILGKEGNYKLNVKMPQTIETLYFLSRQEKLRFINNFRNDLFIRLEEQFENNKEVEMAIIFGSYARREERKTSDLDIFIISDSRKIDRSFESMYNVHASIIIASKEEFVKMIKDKKKIIMDIYTEGIFLKGNAYKILSENYAEW